MHMKDCLKDEAGMNAMETEGKIHQNIGSVDLQSILQSFIRRQVVKRSLLVPPMLLKKTVTWRRAFWGSKMTWITINLFWNCCQ